MSKPTPICHFFGKGTGCRRNPCRFAHIVTSSSTNSSTTAVAKPAPKKKRTGGGRPWIQAPRGVCKWSWNGRPCPNYSTCSYEHRRGDHLPEKDDRWDTTADYDHNGEYDHRDSDWYRDS